MHVRKNPEKVWATIKLIETMLRETEPTADEMQNVEIAVNMRDKKRMQDEGEKLRDKLLAIFNREVKPDDRLDMLMRLVGIGQWVKEIGRHIEDDVMKNTPLSSLAKAAGLGDEIAELFKRMEAKQS